MGHHHHRDAEKHIGNLVFESGRKRQVPWRRGGLVRPVTCLSLLLSLAELIGHFLRSPTAKGNEI